MHQPSLFDYKPSTGGERIVSALLGRRWVNAKTLLALTAMKDRELRAEAAASNGRVISGQKGYCLIEEATVEEITHAAAWLISQGKKMIRRGIEIRSRAHKTL